VSKLNQALVSLAHLLHESYNSSTHRCDNFREATLRGMPSAVGAVAAGPSGREMLENEDANKGGNKKQSRKVRT
jgi:hypothetical protein